MFIDFRERKREILERGRERERERDIDINVRENHWLPLIHTPPRD